MTIQDAKALITLCVDEGLKQGVLKNRGEFEEFLDYLDKYFADTDKRTSGSSTPKDLEEAAIITLDEAESVADEYTDFLEKGLIENQPRPIGGKWFIEYARKRFIAGAKWQAEQLLKSSPLPEDTVLFNKGVEEGKRLMMEETVEGEVESFSDMHPEISIPLNPTMFKVGDKVRIIILPKED